MEKFLGHTVEYWLELNRLPRELRAEDLIQEIATLKGKLSFVQARLDEISLALQDNK